jgi:hypothetical protein
MILRNRRIKQTIALFFYPEKGIFKNTNPRYLFMYRNQQINRYSQILIPKDDNLNLCTLLFSTCIYLFLR